MVIRRLWNTIPLPSAFALRIIAYLLSNSASFAPSSYVSVCGSEVGCGSAFAGFVSGFEACWTTASKSIP